MKKQNAEFESRIKALESTIEKLRERERYYRTIADFTDNWEYWLSHEGTYIYVSPSCRRITGYPPQAFMDDPDLFMRIVHPEDRSLLLVHSKEMLSRDECSPVDFRIITASGDLRWISHTCRPVFDEDGNFLGRRGSNQDATDHILSEKKFQMSEARYHAMFEGISDCVAVYEPIEDGKDFIFKDFNPAAEKLAGIQRSEILGKSVKNVFPAVSEIGLLDIFRRVCRTGKSEHHPVSKYDDQRIALWVENFVYRLPTGEIVAVFKDLTEKKQAEEHLRISDERLQLALEATSDGIWDWDIPTGKAYFSSKYFTMLGYASEEFPSRFATWEHLVHPEDRKWAKQIIFDHIQKNKPFELEFRLKNKAGEWQWVLGRGKIVERDTEGLPIRMVGTHVDIHERKLMEERLFQRMKELESLNRMSQAAALNISLEHVSEAALIQIMETLSPDLALLYLVEGERLNLLGIRAIIPDFNKKDFLQHHVGECLCGMAVLEQSPLFSLNINKDSRCSYNECKITGIQSFAALPLINRGEVIGVLGVGSLKERDYSLQESFLHSLAALVATGMANAYLHQQMLLHATELELTVEKRTKELKKFYNAVEHSHASIVITDLSGTIEYVNPAFTRLTGYSKAEITGHNPKIIKSGYQDRVFYKKMWEKLLSGNTWRGEICNQKKDGTLYWEDVTISPLLDKSGSIANFIGVKEDITEKKQAEKDLRESERRYKTVFSACRDGILIADIKNRCFHYANEAICRMLGYNQSEILELGINDIHPESELPRVLDEFHRQSQGKIDFASELKCLKRNGTVFYCDISVALVTIDGMECIMGFFRDVTERIAAARLKEDVERMMQHDLRSPLTGVISLPKLMMEDTNLTKTQKRFLSLIYESGQKILDMVNLSLAIYQIENGTYKYIPQSFDIKKVICLVMSDIHSKAMTKKIDIQLTCHGFDTTEPENIHVFGEELLAYSIFSNLMTNAVEASPKGGTVVIRMEKTETINIVIHNISAVPTEIRAIFFSKYVTSGKKTGTGLGTYSAKLLSNIQNWQIDMETSESDGTSVSVYIPIL